MILDFFAAKRQKVAITSKKGQLVPHRRLSPTAPCYYAYLLTGVAVLTPFLNLHALRNLNTADRQCILNPVLHDLIHLPQPRAFQ